MRILAFIPVLAVVACAESAAPSDISGSPSNAAQMVNQKDDVFSSPVTACNGEMVVLDGTVHTKVNFTMTGSGKTATSFSADYDLGGIGTLTGAKYNATQRVTERAMIGSNTTNAESDVTLRLVGQGDIPNTLLSMRSHLVVVDGEIKVSHSDITTRCQ
jgi:hypothetical protein